MIKKKVINLYFIIPYYFEILGYVSKQDKKTSWLQYMLAIVG